MKDIFDFFKIKRKKSRTDKLLIKILKRIDALEAEIAPKRTKTVDFLPKNTKNRVGHKEKYILIKGKEANSIEKEMVAELQKNKREFIKERIIDASSTNKYGPKDIKKIIVDKQKYCSKATYYRYLHELKKTKRISIMKINHKEIIYNSGFE